MRSRLRSAGVATLLLAAVAILVLFAPATALAVAPVLTVTTPPAGPGDGRGVPAGPGLDGWWVVPPLVSLSSNQSGFIIVSWDGTAGAPMAVAAGVPVFVEAPEGTHAFSAVAVNATAESSLATDIVFAVDSVAPTQPQDFLAVLIPATGVQLTWSASTDPAPSSVLRRYNVYRKTGLPPFTAGDVVATVEVPGTAHLDTPPGSADDYIYAVGAVDHAGNESPLTEIDPTPTTISVYRFYNRRNGTHFYTASEAERDNVIATLGSTYAFEGPAYRAYGTITGCVPLYRFYNKRNGSHFYTASEVERDNVVATLRSTYDLEGIAYYVSLNSAGTTPVHRFHNRPGGSHFYTSSEAERANVAATLSWAYHYEGVAFYVLPW